MSEYRLTQNQLDHLLEHQTPAAQTTHRYRPGDKACSSGECQANVVCADCGHNLAISASPSEEDVVEAVNAQLGPRGRCPICNGGDRQAGARVKYNPGPNVVCKDASCKGYGRW